MKILLTAPKKTGKSTIIKRFINLFKGELCGFYTEEIRNDDNERTGFKTLEIKGVETIVMSTSNISSGIKLNNKYNVDLNKINEILERSSSKITKDSIYILDEIGPAQLLSDYFKKRVIELLSTDLNFLGTITSENSDFRYELLTNESIILIEVTLENRDSLPKVLSRIYTNLSYFNKLNISQKSYVINNLKESIKNNNFDRAGKLFENAIIYFVENNVSQILENQNIIIYKVNGKTNSHSVEFSKSSNKYSCDCDLFNGRNQFEGKSSICSHIDAVGLLIKC